jgi:hypothetical protein
MYAKSCTVCLSLAAALVLSSPARAVHDKGARSDTTWFGRYSVVGEDYNAVPYALKSDAVWTFDRGIGPMGDPGRIDGGEGWAAINMTSVEKVFLPVPDCAGIADFDCYGASTGCLANNILEAHAGTCDQGYHPVGQSLRLESPICDLGAEWEDAFLEYDRYWEGAQGSLFWRLGWRYYPAPGQLADGWSDRVGSNVWFAVAGADCAEGARTSASSYVPSSAQKVIAVIEIAAFDPFGGPPEPANFPGPLLDNLVVGVVGVRDPAGLGPIADGASHALVVSPNPSSAGMSVAYRLEQAAAVRLEVLDVAGRAIRTLEGGRHPAGSRSVWWDGTDGEGHPVGAGIYWVRLRLGGVVVNRKAVVMR